MNVDVEIREIIEPFREYIWQPDPMPRVLDFLQERPEQISSLIVAIVSNLPLRGSWLANIVLSRMTREDYYSVVRHALAALETDPHNKAAAEVIEQASLQCLPALHPHLTKIFKIITTQQSYYSTWPWREAGAEALTFLRQVLDDPSRPVAHRIEAWDALLETRLPVAFDYAQTLASPREAGFGTGEVSSQQRRMRYWDVGYEEQEGNINSLYSHSTFHLIFPEDYVSRMGHAAWTKRHPTWTLSDEESMPVGFGGSFTNQSKEAPQCPACGAVLQHLMTLNPVPANIGVSGFEKLSLGACLACLGGTVETLFYSHGTLGLPNSVGYHDGPIEPEYKPGGLLPTHARLVRTPDRWRWQNWGPENLHRIGGYPCWVQQPDYLACPNCDRTMQFLIQLDSDLPMDGGDGFGLYQWGSGGIGYGFWCDSCKISGYTAQWT